MKIGQYKITEIINGFASFDAGHIFGIIPKVFLE